MNDRNKAEYALILAELAEHSQRMISLTEVTERLASGITNHVLQSGTYQLQVNGGVFLAAFGWGATCGSVEVHNPGSNVVTVAASTQVGIIPVQGDGVHKIQPGTWRVVNINSRFLTIYSTAADYVGVQAYTTGGLAGGGVG